MISRVKIKQGQIEDFLSQSTIQYVEDVLGGIISVVGYNHEDWDAAYLWGDHSTYGYITGIDNITEIPNRSYTDLQDLPALNIDNWNTAFAWGNHADAGYITGITVTSTNTNGVTHDIGTVEGVILKETVTKLNQPVLDGNVLTLSFLNENDVVQTTSIDLSSLRTAANGITNATYNASTNVITLTEEDGDVWDIDLSEFSIIPTTDINGVTTLTQEGVTKLVVSRVGQTGNFNHLLNIPTTLSGYGITDAYSVSEINDFFSGINLIDGYNKIDWDTAFAWGDHNSMGYVLDQDNVVRVINIDSTNLPPNYTTDDIATYLSNNGFTKEEIETLIIDVNDVAGDESYYYAGEGLNYNEGEFSVDFGTTEGTVARGNDVRIINGQTAFTWGNHANVGYITSVIEDLGYTPATDIQGNRADTAFNWGDHNGLYDKYNGWDLIIDGVSETIESGNSVSLKSGSNISLLKDVNNDIIFNSINNYIKNVTGDGNSVLTIEREGLTDITVDLTHNHDGVYEPIITKNSAFNNDYGTTAGTVAEGNDIRIINGQTAHEWGNHADAGYASQSDVNNIVQDKNYSHTQSVASTDWSITHNLGKYPSVTIIDNAGNEIWTQVEHIDINNLVIRFNNPHSGTASLN
jgi:hypothetical protein